MVNYECVRCHYNSKDKQIMRKHLFGRKQCEGIYSKLDLTDEIRDNILTYGTFQKDNMLKNIIKVEDGFVYIAHTRACIDSNREIFKAGKTKIPENRIKGYTKGTVYKLIVKVKDYHNAEKIILKICREQLIQRKDYGCEYFEGNLISLRDIIISNCDIIENIYDDCQNNKTILYKCVRCGYETKLKNDMRNHFYKRKKMCPPAENDIVLTPEIKDKILEERIYHIPKEEQPKVKKPKITYQKNKIILYKCIRCGYDTKLKNDMRNHFKRKKKCPPEENNIVLTPEITDKILEDRIYHIPR